MIQLPVQNGRQDIGLVKCGDKMKKYINAMNEYLKSSSDYRYEDPRTGEVFIYSRKGTYRKNGRVLVYRGRAGKGAGPMEDYVFSDRRVAVKKSEEIGMNGRVHTTELGDGTIVYIPGATEKEFKRWYKENDGKDI